MKLQRKSSEQALSRVEVLVIVTTTAFLICIGFLWLIQGQHRARSVCCNCNLKQVELAFSIWANDHSNKNPMQVSATNGGTLELVAGGDVFPHFQVLSNVLNSPFILVCPEDKQRLPATNFLAGFSDRTISYFVGVDASDALPEMFLAGDRHISTNGVPLRHGIHELTTNNIVGWTDELHKNTGNVGYVDGSVQTLSSAGLNMALRNTGIETNRLALP
jgi:prepilin-type processing-associated H-X9-DG protein